MTRPIIFRAKAVSSGQWVYGNLIHSKRFAGWSNEWRIHNQDTGLESDVLPETVGQFTGLMARNGKQIFEGDIVTMVSYNHPHLSGRKYSVVYSSDDFCYVLCSLEGKYYIIIGFHSLEVVTNIHDNPYLI